MNSSEKDILIKKLLYKSLHRGCKETDLILGNFATKFINKMEMDELLAFEEILQQNDADIYDWVTGKSPVPVTFQSSVIASLTSYFNKI